MAESNRRRLERLEQMAHVSVGDVRLDASAALELDAQVLEAEMNAYTRLLKAYASTEDSRRMSPESSRQKMTAEFQRKKLADPLRIQALHKELELRAGQQGASPFVKAVLAKAKRFLAETT